MGFAAHQAALDQAVFEHLSDDKAAVWTPRGGVPLQPVRVMLDTVEKPAMLGSMSLPQEAHVVRVLASELTALAPGVDPGEGDAFAVTGQTYVVRAECWRDGGDWLCPVSG